MSLNTQSLDTVDDAARALSDNPRARLLAGGTLVMRAVNDGDQSFDTIVYAKDPLLRELRLDGDELVIGAGVTMAELLRANDAAMLHAAARSIGGPAIRNMATVGGNLFAHHPYGDLATALLALDARVIVAGAAAEQSLEALLAAREQLRTEHTGPAGAAVRSGGRSAVLAAPLVTSIRCRRPQSPDDFRFLKVSRVKPKGISVMCLAAWLPGSARGSAVTGARVAWGAMAATPVRSAAIESALEGLRLDENSIQAAMSVATQGLEPPTDALASSDYRRSVAPVYLGRLLRGGTA